MSNRKKTAPEVSRREFFGSACCAAVGATGLLAGIRTEATEDESWGYVRGRVGSTAAQQVANPLAAATSDYANTRRIIEGAYSDLYPSIHAFHDITPNLKGRVSWSTSFGRPGYGELLPSESVNENASTLTINNAALLPQNARNWDASLDYYFEPVGNVAVSWFSSAAIRLGATTP